MQKNLGLFSQAEHHFIILGEIMVVSVYRTTVGIPSLRMPLRDDFLNQISEIFGGMKPEAAWGWEKYCSAVTNFLVDPTKENYEQAVENSKHDFVSPNTIILKVRAALLPYQFAHIQMFLDENIGFLVSQGTRNFYSYHSIYRGKVKQDLLDLISIFPAHVLRIEIFRSRDSLGSECFSALCKSLARNSGSLFLEDLLDHPRSEGVLDFTRETLARVAPLGHIYHDIIEQRLRLWELSEDEIIYLLPEMLRSENSSLVQFILTEKHPNLLNNTKAHGIIRAFLSSFPDPDVSTHRVFVWRAKELQLHLRGFLAPPPSFVRRADFFKFTYKRTYRFSEEEPLEEFEQTEYAQPLRKQFFPENLWTLCLLSEHYRAECGLKVYVFLSSKSAELAIEKLSQDKTVGTFYFIVRHMASHHVTPCVYQKLEHANPTVLELDSISRLTYIKYPSEVLVYRTLGVRQASDGLCAIEAFLVLKSIYLDVTLSNVPVDLRTIFSIPVKGTTLLPASWAIATQVFDASYTKQHNTCLSGGGTTLGQHRAKYHTPLEISAVDRFGEKLNPIAFEAGSKKSLNTYLLLEAEKVGRVVEEKFTHKRLTCSDMAATLVDLVDPIYLHRLTL